MSGSSHALQAGRNFFAQFIHSTSVYENHDSADGSTVLCLHGKYRLKCFLIASPHTYSSSYEHVSHGGFRHLREVQASRAKGTSLIPHFIAFKPRGTQSLPSQEMKLKIRFFTRVIPFFPPGFSTIGFVTSYCI